MVGFMEIKDLLESEKNKEKDTHPKILFSFPFQ